MPLDASELYTGFSPIRASHVKQFFDLLTGITTDQAVQLKNGLTVTNGLTVSSGTTTVGAVTSSGTITSNGIINLVGGQLAFPATAVPSANGNALDDYEEGSWTPVIGGSATYTAQDCIYVKIGKHVLCSGRLVITLIGTGSTTTISGLPFTAAGTTRFTGSVGVFAALGASPVFLTITTVAGAGTTMTFPGLTAAATGTTNLAIFANNAEVNFSINYDI